ncbi:hypothetical protein BT69DRAFT_1291748 [Atractiella rhizophila]|nr:hypothetical protein BT69DRAFT_1291748 [Atractiella rhizophila]
MLPPPGSQLGREELTSPSAVRDIEVDSTSMWDPISRVPGYQSNARLEPQTPKAKKFLNALLPNVLDHEDPIKILQLLRDFLYNTRRLMRNQNLMTFKNHEFDFLDSLMNHLSTRLSSPEARDSPSSVGLEVKRGIETLKGQPLWEPRRRNAWPATCQNYMEEPKLSTIISLSSPNLSTTTLPPAPTKLY